MDEARRLVLEFFKGDEKKADLWFRTPNPLLGGLSPDDMIKLGRSETLLQWIETMVEENRPTAKEEDACRHGHVPFYDDPVCLECVRENARDFAYEEAARVVDEEIGRNSGISQEFLRNLAERIRGLKGA